MKYTIQQIFNQFSDEYLKKYTPSYEQRKVLNKILDCRTEKLGTRIYQCEDCGKKILTYNSCKDRHCPSCQSYKKEVWINNHQDDILDITYFHVVTTVPSELHPIFYHNQRKMYSILFKVASETIMELCQDSKYLGAKVGITAMLHTWSQKGNYHPHIHMIVTGGGIDKMGNWKDSNPNYLLPVQVISRKFRGKLLDNIKKQQLKFYKDYDYLNDETNLNNYLSPLYKKEWVCYSKPPFKNVGEIYNYLGRYAFRVCMSNERIEKIEKNYVYFNYKDRKDRNIKKKEKIKGEEFIRKFLLHALPDSFMKIRYYGLLAGKGKKERIKKIKIMTKTRTIRLKFKTKIEILNKMNGRDITKCQKCNGNIYLVINSISNKSPPINNKNLQGVYNA